MIFYSPHEAVSQGADYQLYEFQRHTIEEERWMMKEIERIKQNPKRIIVPVKQGIYITIFVDDIGHKERQINQEKVE